MIDEVLKEIKARKFKPVYILHGEEAYYIDLISDVLEEQVLDAASKSFNQVVLYGKDTDTMTILNAAKRFPMMSEHQLILVKEAQELDVFSGRASKEKEHKLELLNAYFQNPLSSTILVLCHKYGKVDKRLKIIKSADKNGVVVESEKIYENKVPTWAAQYVNGKGFKLNAKAGVLIADFLGNDLSKIANELDKLMINLPKGIEIGLNEVEANIGISKEFNVFELQIALAKKDGYKSNLIINYFAANPKSNPMIRVLSTLNNYFTKVFSYHYLKDKSKANVARVLKVNPYFVDDYELAAKNYPLPKLIQVISLLREYDLKSKGVDAGNAEEGDLLKELIHKIIYN